MGKTILQGALFVSALMIGYQIGLDFIPVIFKPTTR